jgi:hypothetical protein
MAIVSMKVAQHITWLGPRHPSSNLIDREDVPHEPGAIARFGQVAVVAPPGVESRVEHRFERNADRRVAVDDPAEQGRARARRAEDEYRLLAGIGNLLRGHGNGVGHPSSEDTGARPKIKETDPRAGKLLGGGGRR